MSTLLPRGPKGPTANNKGFGKYTIKATSRVIKQGGKGDHIKIRGYGKDMSIVERVDKITKVKAHINDMGYTESTITFMQRSMGVEDGIIFLDYVDSNKTILVP
tara:strand:- start:1427 stop:1738 length:312 start_codon:yes stop_codon:yes gene_type:complete